MMVMVGVMVMMVVMVMVMVMMMTMTSMHLPHEVALGTAQASDHTGSRVDDFPSDREHGQHRVVCGEFVGPLLPHLVACECIHCTDAAVHRKQQQCHTCHTS